MCGRGGGAIIFTEEVMMFKDRAVPLVRRRTSSSSSSCCGGSAVVVPDQRVLDQNDVAQACYMAEIHHSGREPSVPCWLLYTPCWCNCGTDLLRKVYDLPH